MLREQNVRHQRGRADEQPLPNRIFESSVACHGSSSLIGWRRTATEAITSQKQFYVPTLF
jgi:hypothetical protein